jgi:hypothetical protein
MSSLDLGANGFQSQSLTIRVLGPTLGSLRGHKHDVDPAIGVAGI